MQSKRFISAPLVCEGSIQLLRSAFNESAMAATDEISTLDSSSVQRYHSISSYSLNEQVSLAKNNCGIMKNCYGSCRDGLKSTSFSQQDTQYYR